MSIPYALSGEGCVLAGEGAGFTLVPDAPTTDTVTFSDGDQGGTFTPSSLKFSGEGAPKRFGYSNPMGGVYELTLTSEAGNPISNNPFTLTVKGGPPRVPAVVGPEIHATEEQPLVRSSRTR